MEGKIDVKKWPEVGVNGKILEHVEDEDLHHPPVPREAALPRHPLPLYRTHTRRAHNLVEQFGAHTLRDHAHATPRRSAARSRARHPAACAVIYPLGYVLYATMSYSWVIRESGFWDEE